MKLNKNSNTNILIVGLGLMGGSYAIALKKRGYHVEAVDLEQKSIDYALEKGMIDEGSVQPTPEMLKRADLTIFALYPKAFIEWLKTYQQDFKTGAILTDVTGVKEPLVKEIQEILRPDLEFISAHPMAGREVSGVENSTDRIFEGANYIVVPTKKNTPEGIALCKELGKELGFHFVSCLSPKEHDEMIGFLSQLTHCIAVSLMCCHDTEALEQYTGDSFRDLTRIAKINDRMWSELFMLNKDELLRQMDVFADQFSQLRNYLETGDVEGMRQMMQISTARRQRFDQ